MIFTRTYRYQTSLKIDDIKRRLLGQHVKIHNLDFEVMEKDEMIKVVPYAEQDAISARCPSPTFNLAVKETKHN